MDFNAKRRDEVFAHLYQKYRNNFAHIGTHGTLQAKNAFKDVCRIFNVPFQRANYLSSILPDGISSITEALEDEKFKKEVDSDPVIQDVINYSKNLEGTIKSYGIHACIAPDQRLNVNGRGSMTISKAYKTFGGEQPISIMTNRGWRQALVVKTQKKRVHEVIMTSRKTGEVVSILRASKDHKISLAYNSYVPIGDMKLNQPYDVNLASPWPSAIGDKFICGFLLAHIIRDPVKNTIGYAKGTIAALETLAMLYKDGMEALKHRYINEKPEDVLGKVEYETGWTTNNGVISPVYNDRSYTRHYNSYYSPVVNNSNAVLTGFLAAFEWSGNQKNYVPAKFPIRGRRFIEFANRIFIRKNIPPIQGNFFEVSDVAYKKFALNNLFIPLYTEPGDVVLTRVGSGDAVQMYDLQIITPNPDAQNYVTDCFDVHNCGIILSPVPLNETVPLYAQDGLPVTMYDGPTMEKLNFI